jgi:hypothetical protein
MQPIGIKLIAALHWLRGAAYLVGALAIMGVAHLGARLISAVTNDTPINRILASGGTAFAVLLVICALFWIVLGYGIWATRNWARVLTLVFAGLWLLFGLLRIGAFPTPWHILRLVIDAAIVVYLLLPDVKRAFGATGI